MLLQLDQGWFPHDEGALGQSAERVLAGEVPHRDFDELYTGALSYLNALAFQLGGIRPVTLRVPLLLATLGWLVAVYRLALRFVPVTGAVLVTAAALAWSVPNYPAAMPSWYNLFCATWGLLALARWYEDGRRRWLFLAGLAGGISFLFKLPGLFYLAGVGLALVWATAPPLADRKPRGLALVQVGLAAVLVAAVAMLWRVAGAGGAREVVRFVMPVAVVSLAIAVREWRGGGMGAGERGRALARLAWPVALGALLPVAGFGLAFAAAGGLDELLRGVFITPFRRVTVATTRPAPLQALLGALPVLWLLWPRRDIRLARWSVRLAPVVLLLGLVLYLSGQRFQFYRVGWWAGWSLLILVAVAGAWLVAARDRLDPRRPGDGLLVALVTVAAGAALVEFPFAAPIYTLYALPVSLLAVAAIVRRVGLTPVPLQVIAIGFFLAFGLVRLLPGTVEGLGVAFAPSRETARLPGPRGGLRVPVEEAEVYGALIPLVAQVAAGGTVWAGPDAPEVYFLGGFRNQTRTLVDAFDTEPEPPGGLPARLRRLGITVVVIKDRSDFSPPLADPVRDALAQGWPQARELDGFTVRWR